MPTLFSAIDLQHFSQNKDYIKIKCDTRRKGRIGTLISGAIFYCKHKNKYYRRKREN